MSIKTAKFIEENDNAEERKLELTVSVDSILTTSVSQIKSNIAQLEKRKLAEVALIEDAIAVEIAKLAKLQKDFQELKGITLDSVKKEYTSKK